MSGHITPPGATYRERRMTGPGPRSARQCGHELLCGERERYRYGMAIRVECYAGYRGEQEPLAFWLGERRLAVRAVVDRWFAPTQRWFRVEADDGNVYVLRQGEAIGDWEIAAFRCGPG
jgi:hypothetical protein